MKHTNTYGQSQDLAVLKPTVQALDLVWNDVSNTLSWTRGNGGRVLVLLKKTDAIDKTPRDGTTYYVSDFICCNEIIYKGVGTSIVLDLDEGTYFARAFEFNGFASVERYLTTVANDNPLEFVASDGVSTGIFDETFDDTFE